MGRLIFIARIWMVGAVALAIFGAATREAHFLRAEASKPTTEVGEITGNAHLAQ